MIDTDRRLRSRCKRRVYPLVFAALSSVVAASSPHGSISTAATGRIVDLGLESASERRKLPLYKIIPAAKDAELTPAIPQTATQGSWPRSYADAANSRFSALSQINRDNVGKLQMAWTYRSGDGTGNIQATPVIVDGVMYAPTVGRNIVAVNAATGREMWRFELPAPARKASFYDPAQRKFIAVDTEQKRAGLGYGPAQHGLTYWAGDGQRGPRLFFMSNGYLVAVDPRTGESVAGFGENGIAASSKGAGSSNFLGAVAPAVYRDIIVAPNQTMVDAFNVVTGKRLWSFNTLTYPVADPNPDNGANVWGGIAMDLARGIVFVQVGDPHPNLVGIDRPGNNEHTDSILALDVNTGRKLWSFQVIAHDIWDLDVPAAPNLVTVTIRGKRVDAVAQVTKLGITVLLDRGHRVGRHAAQGHALGEPQRHLVRARPRERQAAVRLSFASCAGVSDTRRAHRALSARSTVAAAFRSASVYAGRSQQYFPRVARLCEEHCGQSQFRLVRAAGRKPLHDFLRHSRRVRLARRGFRSGLRVVVRRSQ